MKLISMTDFVLEQRLKYAESFKSKVYAYANFLKQRLTLGMFVPCDEDGILLEEPKDTNKDSLAYDWFHEQYRHKQVIYKQAQERVLFEGFELSKGNLIKHNWCKIFFLKHKNGYTYFELTDFTKEELPVIEIKTIEDLTIVFNLALTPQAIKQIGL